MSVQVPREFVHDGEIVLNISFDATSSLQLGNDFIEFKARFGGKPRDILVPVGRVIAIYARENGQGMAFPPPVDSLVAAPSSSAVLAPVADVVESGASVEDRVVQLVPAVDVGDDEPPKPTPGSAGGRPSLKRVK